MAAKNTAKYAKAYMKKHQNYLAQMVQKFIEDSVDKTVDEVKKLHAQYDAMWKNYAKTMNDLRTKSELKAEAHIFPEWFYQATCITNRHFRSRVKGEVNPSQYREIMRIYTIVAKPSWFRKTFPNFLSPDLSPKPKPASTLRKV